MYTEDGCIWKLQVYEHITLSDLNLYDMWILESGKAYNLQPRKNIIYYNEILQRAMLEKLTEDIIEQMVNKKAIQ